MNEHTVATYAMLAVGVALIVLYFTISSAAENQIKPSDDNTKLDKYINQFKNSMAGILSIGSMFVAFSLAVIAIENKIENLDVGSKLGGSYQRYMIFMAVIGIVVLGLAASALSTIDSDNANDGAKTARSQLMITIALSAVATIVAVGFIIVDRQKSSKFGFDFEF
jgi:NhaP-type Na+/H+ or K+/H+ antiporter